MPDELKSHKRVVFKFEFYPESRTIGLYDQYGFLGSVMTPQTLWKVIESESVEGRGYNRLILEADGPIPKGQPDWNFIEEVFKRLDEEGAKRRRLSAQPEQITLGDLDL